MASEVEQGASPFSIDTILNKAFDKTTNKIGVDTEISLSGNVIIQNIARKPDGSQSPLELDESGNLKVNLASSGAGLATEGTLATRASESTLSGIAADIDNIQAKFNVSLSTLATEGTVSGTQVQVTGIKNDTGNLTTAFDSSTNSFSFREKTPSTLNSSQINVVAGGTQIIASNTSRREVLIRNFSSSEVSVGPSGSVLMPLSAKESITIKATVAIIGSVTSGISPADVRVLEESY